MNEAHQSQLKDIRTKMAVEKQDIFKQIELKQEVIDDIRYWLEHELEKSHEKSELDSQLEAVN